MTVHLFTESTDAQNSTLHDSDAMTVHRVRGWQARIPRHSWLQIRQHLIPGEFGLGPSRPSLRKLPILQPKTKSLPRVMLTGFSGADEHRNAEKLYWSSCGLGLILLPSPPLSRALQLIQFIGRQHPIQRSDAQGHTSLFDLFLRQTPFTKELGSLRARLRSP